MQGRFSWYELMTPDPAAAQRFYTTLIGWGLQNFEAPGGAQPTMGGEPYVMWTRGGQPIGGVMRLPEEAKQMGAPPHWLGYVGVENVDASVAKATGLGARVYVPPTDIPGGGRFAVLADPQGAVFGVVGSQAPSEGRDTREPGVGDFSWHELATTDLDAATTFYARMFGWQKREAHDMGPLGIYQEYGTADRALGGMYKKPADMPAPPHWMLYVSVPDVDRAAGQVKAMGGQILHGPADVPGGDRILMCLDPQGAAFALHQKKA
jgi:uncharacterized protein